VYGSSLNSRDRSGALAASVAIQAALLIAFFNMSGKIDLSDTQSPLRLVDISPLPPPPPVAQRQAPKLAAKEGASAPKNIESKATPVVAPKPVIETPTVQQIVATETPRQAVDPTQGASPVRGPGTGAGGVGNGTGSGGAGNGSGDGGGVAEPPHLATPVLRGYDFPREILDQWPPAATIFLRLKVDARGYVAECMVDRGTNVPQIDAQMCNTAHERLRFRPALNRSGEAVAGWFGYAQPAPR
jgi:protein TonB